MFLTSTLGRGAGLLAQNFSMCRLVPCIKLSLTILSPAFGVNFWGFVASERHCLSIIRAIIAVSSTFLERHLSDVQVPVVHDKS